MCKYRYPYLADLDLFHFIPCVWQLSELKKTNERVLEAEKGKCFAEATNKALEEKVREIGSRLSAAEDKLRAAESKLSVADGKLKEAEMHRQLLKKEAESYKDEVKETHDKMEEENMRLSSDLAKLCLQEEAARMRLQETERVRAALETRVAGLQAEVESGRREREEELACHERQLSDARRQQETVEGELKVVWKEMGEKQERWACGGMWYSMYTCVDVPFCRKS